MQFNRPISPHYKYACTSPRALPPKQAISKGGMTASNFKPSHLHPSELGTKEYWDTAYTADLDTPPSPSSSLPGWFSDIDASTKILHYLSSPSLSVSPATTTVLDLGTGNGEMLFLLREEGQWGGRMVGVDYSGSSVDLARRMAEARGLVRGLLKVEFEVWDIMEDAPRGDWGEGFDVVLDKGTFDAVSLNGETDAGGRRVCEGYTERVERLVRGGGLVLITSCNWTEGELEGWFGGGDLEVAGRVEYPRFRFGGASGQSISSVCFRKKK